jgi:PAS domain S-box-containing protein
MAAEREVEIALCVFREANDALIVFDPRDRRVVDVNPAALRLTGFDRKVVMASKVGDLLAADDPDDFRRLIEAFQRTSFFHAREGYRLTTQDGPAIPVSVSVSRIHTSPEPLGLALVRDISARKKAEAELKRARDDLEARVEERTAELARAVEGLRAEVVERRRVEAELRQAKEAAEAAGQVKDRFLAVLSHELRTPLTPVLAVVSALLDDSAIPEAFRPAMEMIRRNVALEARLIDDLLDVMRDGRGMLRIEPEPVDAHELIRTAVEVCRPAADSAGARIVVDLGARDRFVDADPTRLQQVVWNLLQNAVKSAGEGGAIVVRTADGPGGRLVVAVEDDGGGIEPDVLPRIFEPFEQGSEPARRKAGGLGLGLAISRSIVERHGGTLTAASDGPDRGATFTFELPGARAEPVGKGEPRTAPTVPVVVEPAVAHVLLVEDNKDVLRYLRIVLEMKGHRVIPAASLGEAREASTAPFDLLVSDIELPDGSGLELMRELRGRVPGIAISGFGAADDVQISLAAGFARHLTKPVEAQQLESTIREVLAENRREPA